LPRGIGVSLVELFDLPLQRAELLLQFIQFLVNRRGVGDP
jgi:hypothetical protein